MSSNLMLRHRRVPTQDDIRLSCVQPYADRLIEYGYQLSHVSYFSGTRRHRPIGVHIYQFDDKREGFCVKFWVARNRYRFVVLERGKRIYLSSVRVTIRWLAPEFLRVFQDQVPLYQKAAAA